MAGGQCQHHERGQLARYQAGGSLLCHSGSGRRTGPGTERRAHFPRPRWWGCDVGGSGWVITRLKAIGWLGTLAASGKVLEDDGEVTTGVGVRSPEGGTWRGWGAPVPAAHPCPSPWCLPAASEVAPSCPLPQAPRGHPIQMPASRGTPHVQRSRSSWKRLSSTHPSWYTQPLEGARGGD